MDSRRLFLKMDFSETSHDKLPPIDRNRELLKTARSEVYKKAGGVDLNVYIWEPEKVSDYPRSAVAFFFSSGRPVLVFSETS